MFKKIKKYLKKKRLMYAVKEKTIWWIEQNIRRIICRIYPDRVMLFNKKDFWVKPNDPGISTDLFLFGIREQTMTNAIRVLFEDNPPKGTFLDIGANLGYYSAVLSKYFDIIVAVEVNEKLIHILRKNIPKNSKIINKAVVGDITKNYVFEERSESNLGKVSESTAGRTDKINVISFDEILLEYRPSMIKMDIEGSEYEIIENSSFKHKPKYLFIEIHFSLNTQERSVELMKKLKQLGYMIKFLVGGNKRILNNKNDRLYEINMDIDEFLEEYRGILTGEKGEAIEEFLLVR